MLCRSYRLSVPSNDRFVQLVINYVLMTFASTGGYETSLGDLKKSHGAEKADLEKLLPVSQEKLADAKCRIK